MNYIVYTVLVLVLPVSLALAVTVNLIIKKWTWWLNVVKIKLLIWRVRGLGSNKLILVRVQNLVKLVLGVVIVASRLPLSIESIPWSQLAILRLFKRETLTRRVLNSSPGGSWRAQSLFVRIPLFWLLLYNFTFCVYLPISLFWPANCSLNIKSCSIFV